MKGRKYIEGSSVRPRIFKRTTTGIKISPLGIALLCIGIAGAMLSGLLYTQFYIEVSSPIELTGAVVPLFYFDDQEFTGRWFNTSADITTINAGETKSFLHHIRNADSYCWELSIDTSFMDAFASDPFSPFYGFNITVTPDKVFFIPGTEINVWFNYSLHHEFVGTELPLDFDLKLNITKVNGPPTATDDSVTGYSQSAFTVDVLANDFDYEEDTLTIISITPISASHISAEILNNQIRVTPDGAWTTTATFDYVISDGTSTDTGRLTVLYAG